MKHLGLCVVTTMMLMINANTEATCPQPYIGPPGVTGATGPVGPMGDTGATGATGPYVTSLASAFDYGYDFYDILIPIDPGESEPILFSYESFDPVNLVKYPDSFPFIVAYEIQTSGYYLVQTDVTFAYEDPQLEPVTVSLINYNGFSVYQPDPIAISTSIIDSRYKTVSGQTIVYMSAGDFVGLLAHNYGDEYDGVSVIVTGANLSIIQLSE